MKSCKINFEAYNIEIYKKESNNNKNITTIIITTRARKMFRRSPAKVQKNTDRQEDLRKCLGRTQDNSVN